MGLFDDNDRMDQSRGMMDDTLIPEEDMLQDAAIPPEEAEQYSAELYEAIESTEDTSERQGEEGGMSVREAGKKGGEVVKQKYGPSFYSEIGHMGGEARKEQLGSEGYEDLGHKGGQRVKELIERGKQAEDDASSS